MGMDPNGERPKS